MTDYPEILTPEQHRANGGGGSNHFHDPYTESGARSILRRFRDDMVAMLLFMESEASKWSDADNGVSFLAQSPLRRKVYVAGAMKTLGLITEHPSANGACSLRLTERGRKQIAIAKTMGWI